ncbi:MAG: valine--tRNA ligase [Candidatus Buchananbacteria bacterium]|nr:valine--tRNA ligase [Candidatus Buchananbacteria bacterium]
MQDQEFSKAYEPNNYEDSIYKAWEESGFFNPDNLPGKRTKSFSISMPPPNATGNLHIGHAVMLAIQDLTIRFQRMRGQKTLWLPGTDHAAIATQNKVEKLIKAKSGKTRHDLGRAEFLKQVNDFVIQSQTNIKNQVRKMGSSCDWTRERYTLDEGLTKAVSTAFVEMYNDGLIYRGSRIVNWCPRCLSTLADDEVEYKPTTEKLYWIKYGPFTLATSRPETKLGDTAVAVYPGDERYQKFVGKKIMIPGVLGEFEVTVVEDKAVDPKFGTGVIKVTPAHDFTDYEIAQRHNIVLKQIINEEGKMMANCGKYAGLTTRECRSKIVEDMQRMGLIEKIEDYDHNLSICYRCGTPVEPLPSKQWFINVNKEVKKLGGKTIKQKALEVVKEKEIEIIPDRFNKTYYHWIENLRDWCISRQIWFGHRIPVWYRNTKHGTRNMEHETSEEIYVGLEAPKGDGWQQDPDSLDTWFSSGLWTFSTLGWPEITKDLKTFHPTSLMETGYDILFFWVARMIIMSTYLMGEIPFKHVYLHGLIRDENGVKMSKSLDNVIDPLDVIKKYGADATRLSLLIGTTPGNDMNLSESKIGGYRNFVNKLWNISRYILINVKNPRLIEKQPSVKTLADQWILAELNLLIDFATKNLESYNFSVVGEKIYEFTWSKLADWYVEISKVESDKEEILLYILQNLLKLWQPFTPFVTQVIWQNLDDKNLLMIQDWPKASGKVDKKVIKDFDLVKEVVSTIRNLRSESNISPSQEINAVIVAGSSKKLIEQESLVISRLARLKKIEVLTSGKKSKASLSAVVGKIEIYLPVAGTLDVKKELNRLTVEEKRVRDFVAHLEAKLKNQRFLERAPKEIIEKEKVKLADHKVQLEKIKQQLKTLK